MTLTFVVRCLFDENFQTSQNAQNGFDLFVAERLSTFDQVDQRVKHLNGLRGKTLNVEDAVAHFALREHQLKRFNAFQLDLFTKKRSK